MTLSDRILSANDDVLGRMLNHRFVADICADRLPTPVFHRYLAYEGAFVETAISIFAHGVVDAPDMAARRWLIGVLDSLANDQIAYFEKTFAELGIAQPATLPPKAEAFRSGMAASAENGFIDVVASMFAAEWMYWHWCKRAASCDIGDRHLRQWVDMHADKTFAAQALWLKDAIDRHGDPADLDRLSALFQRVMELEIQFHDAPYDEAEHG